MGTPVPNGGRGDQLSVKKGSFSGTDWGNGVMEGEVWEYDPWTTPWAE